MNSDLDLRKLRYFVAVATTLNFRRAAEDLYLAQPVLSRQIRALENELGLTLFDRGPRGTELTPAGAGLLADATRLLADASALARRLKRTSESRRTLNVAVMPGLLATAATANFKRRHQGWEVSIRASTWSDQSKLVRDGTVDVSLAREPVDATGLNVVPVTQEERLALVPRGSALSELTTLTVADLGSELLLQDPALFPEWAAITTARLRSRAANAVPLSSVEEKMEHVASGDGFVVLPRSTCSYYQRPDVQVVPIEGLALAQVYALFRHDAEPEVQDYAETVAALGPTIVGIDARE